MNLEKRSDLSTMLPSLLWRPRSKLIACAASAKFRILSEPQDCSMRSPFALSLLPILVHLLCDDGGALSRLAWALLCHWWRPDQSKLSPQNNTNAIKTQLKYNHSIPEQYNNTPWPWPLFNLAILASDIDMRQQRWQPKVNSSVVHIKIANKQTSVKQLTTNNSQRQCIMCTSLSGSLVKTVLFLQGWRFCDNTRLRDILTAFL